MTPQEASQGLLSLCRQIEQIAKAVAMMDVEQPVFPKEKLALIENRICLKCGEPIEDTEKPARGCHSRCYKAINTRINAGEFTDSQAVASGKLYYKSLGGRRESDENAALKLEVLEAQPPLAKKAKGYKKP